MDYISVKECQKALVTKSWFSPTMMSVETRKYFSIEVDPVTGKWTIEAGPYVGIVPLTADYGIQILPKSGLRNLTYMLYRSGLLNRSLETPFDETVSYQVPEDDLESFFEGLVLSFLRAVDVIKAWGLMRESTVESRDSYAVRGKIDFLRWARSFPRTGGLPIPQHAFTPELNNLPNRILYRCLDYLARYPLRYVNRAAVVGRLEYFGQIPLRKISSEEVTQLERQLETSRFPASRYYYLPALNLALLIFRNAGLALGEEAEVEFKPILIDTAHMFEKYARTVFQEAVQPFDAHAEDGKQQPLPFYKEAPRPIFVQPDILVQRGGSTFLLADVKYKFAPTPQDHYQLWAYMNVHQVQRAGFISIADPGRGCSVSWSRRNQYSIFDFAFDCRDAKGSEQQLSGLIGSQIKAVLA